MIEYAKWAAAHPVCWMKRVARFLVPGTYYTHFMVESAPGSGAFDQPVVCIWKMWLGRTRSAISFNVAAVR